jgi:histidinol phosphatase-like PHP family hydrolase
MTFSKIKRDYHVHTTFSDGYSSPEEMIKFGITKKIDQICFTDHFSTFKPAIAIDTLDFYFESIQELKAEFSNKIQLFVGIEVDTSSILNFGRISENPWDLILFEYVFSQPSWERTFAEVKRFVQDNPTRNVGLAHTRFSRITHAKFEEVMDSIRELGLIIELNTGYRNYSDAWFNYLDEGNKFSIGSDAHSIDQLGNVNDAISFLKSRNIPLNRIIEL